MLNIKTLLLEDFRVFSGSSVIKLAPVTILTGTNNSGKSSIAGSINLMKNLDRRKLPFRISGHDLVLNNRTNKSRASMGYDLYNIILGEDIKVLFTFGRNRNSDTILKEISIRNMSGILFDFKFEEDRIISSLGISYLYKKLRQIKESKPLYSDLECKFGNIRTASRSYNGEKPDDSAIRIFRIDNDLKRKKILQYLREHGIEIREYERLNYFFGSRIGFPGYEVQEDRYIKKIKKILEIFDENDILFNSSFLTRILAISSGDLNELQLRAVIENEFPDLYENLSGHQSDSLNNIIDLLKLKSYKKLEDEYTESKASTTKHSIGGDVEKELSEAIESHLQSIFDESSFFSALTDLSRNGKGLLKEYKNYTNLRMLALFCELVLGKIFHDLESDLDKSLMVCSEKINPDIDFYDLVKSYSDEKGKNNFLSSWLEKFRISIGPANHEGRGTCHLLTMLLSIAGARQYHDLRDYNDDQRDYPRTLIFEEPEANLYPAWQSQLADMFIDANKRLGLHFLIETHSAYLIKKLRYLVAKGQIDKNDIIIYYIENPDQGKRKAPILREILISEDGDFSQELGTGFFDESETNLFSLRKFSKN